LERIDSLNQIPLFFPFRVGCGWVRVLLSVVIWWWCFFAPFLVGWVVCACVLAPDRAGGSCQNLCVGKA